MRWHTVALAIACVTALIFPVGVGAMADVQGHRHEEAIDRMVEQGILEGMPDGNFYPERELNRAQAAKVAALLSGHSETDAGRAEGRTLFADVGEDMPAEKWARGWINLIAGDGLIVGDGHGYYNPEDPLTMREWATILMRVLGYSTEGLQWPSGYDARIAELDLDYAVQFSGDENISRAKMARMSDTAQKQRGETRISYRDGIYEGELQDGMPHGSGTWEDEEGHRYSGEWHEGRMHGEGTFTWASGHEYTGEYRDDLRHGYGVYVWANGDRYEGEFVDNEMHGEGTLELVPGDTYEGEFREGRMTGRGFRVWESGDEYRGDFVDGKPQGEGTFTWDSGAEYTGEMKDGQLHGEGVYTSTDGERLQGQWVNNELAEVNEEPDYEEDTDEPALPSVGESDFLSRTRVSIPRTGELHLVGQDMGSTYLGRLTTNEFATDSVFNDYGRYGSRFSTTSIWNSFSRFGSRFSSYSAFNSYASSPPMIVHVGAADVSLVGYVTTNSFRINDLHPDDLYRALRDAGH